MSAVVRIEAGRRFPVPVREGFDYITDPGNWLEYWPRAVRVHPDTRWREPGDRARLVMRMLGRAIELEAMGSNERRVVHEHLRDRPEVEELTGQRWVPVLVHGDEVIHDSHRILEYLDWLARRKEVA